MNDSGPVNAVTTASTSFDPLDFFSGALAGLLALAVDADAAEAMQTASATTATAAAVLGRQPLAR